MKQLNLLFLAIFIFVSAHVFSQSKFAISYAPVGQNSLLQKTLDGAPSHQLNSSGVISLQFLHDINTNYSFETGLDYSLFLVETIPAFNPTAATDTTVSNLAIVQIPLALRYNPNDYFFVSAGALLSFDTNATAPINNQSGVGLITSIGLQYPFANGIALFANPYLKLHSIIPFNIQQNYQRLLESGIKFGISYSFK